MNKIILSTALAAMTLASTAAMAQPYSAYGQRGGYEQRAYDQRAYDQRGGYDMVGTASR